MEEIRYPQWKVDEINLAEIAQQGGLHLATCIDLLASGGIERRDAEAFMDFYFHEVAVHNRGIVDKGVRAEDWVTEEQWERLNLDYL